MLKKTAWFLNSKHLNNNESDLITINYSSSRLPFLLRDCNLKRQKTVTDRYGETGTVRRSSDEENTVVTQQESLSENEVHNLSLTFQILRRPFGIKFSV